MSYSKMANPSAEFVGSYSLPLELPLLVHVDKWWYVVNVWSTCQCVGYFF